MLNPESSGLFFFFFLILLLLPFTIPPCPSRCFRRLDYQWAVVGWVVPGVITGAGLLWRAWGEDAGVGGLPSPSLVPCPRCCWCALAVLAGALPGFCAGLFSISMVPVRPGGKSSAPVEVCCMTLAQHTSTNCDSAYSTGYSHWLMLSMCWRSISLLYVWLLGCLGVGRWGVVSNITAQTTTQSFTLQRTTAHHTDTINVCLMSLSVLFFRVVLLVKFVLCDRIRVADVHKIWTTL